MSKGRVLSVESNRFLVDIDGKSVLCSAEKKIRLNRILGTLPPMPAIVPGDFVEVNTLDSVITKRLERKNFLIRPLVANVDQIVFVLAAAPKPDLLLLDKLLINCFNQKISVAICLNKIDICDKMLVELKEQYNLKIVASSAETKQLEGLKKQLKGKLSAICGQSAVGKSSLINALQGLVEQKTQGLSKKISRGKNTTTRTKLIPIDLDTVVFDTPGFSMLDIPGIEKSKLQQFYPEFLQWSGGCKFASCTHTVEPNCAVISAVENGEINKKRYERYLVLRNTL